MRARAWPALVRLAALAVVTASMAVVVSVPTRVGAAPAHRPRALGTIVLAQIGFGYSVTSQGPLDASRFPPGSPSAAAAAGALGRLGHTIETYERSWQDATGVNQVQDLVVRFPTDAGARAFVAAARRSLAKAEVVSTRALPSVPAAQRTTYFASTDRAGVGQTITLYKDTYAAVLSYFSGASGNPAPITTASAARVAKAQYEAIVSAVGPVNTR
jgi:hypothetical protein